MLAGSQVFGARAGRHAARRGKEFANRSVGEATVKKGVARIETLARANRQLSIEAIAQPLRRLATEEMLVARTHESLARLLDQVVETRRALSLADARRPPDLVKALELENMLLVAEMTARAAMMRTESRGGHYRVEFPDRNDRDWLRVIRIRTSEAGMQLDTFVIDPEWRERSVDMGNTVWG